MCAGVISAEAPRGEFQILVFENGQKNRSRQNGPFGGEPSAKVFSNSVAPHLTQINSRDSFNINPSHNYQTLRLMPSLKDHIFANFLSLFLLFFFFQFFFTFSVKKKKKKEREKRKEKNFRINGRFEYQVVG